MPASSITAIPFGRGLLPIELSAEIITPPSVPPLPDPAAAIRHALDHPAGCKPLRSIVRPGEKIVIVVNDITRLSRTELVLPLLVEVLNEAGVPDSDITVVFALGIHRRQTPEEQRRIVGEEMYRRLKLMDHDANDAAQLVSVGTTSFGNAITINRTVIEADRVILTGEIILHRIAGYSGGRKSLLPGVAGHAAVTYNHAMIFHPLCRAGILDGNPAHEDMLEACRMVDPDFIVNVVLTPAGEIATVVAGHYELAHRQGCRAADSLLRTPLPAPYDILVASAGGDPLDIDLRQAHKGLENACLALREGGAILFYAECSHGSGSPHFEDFAFRYRTEEEMERALRENFAVGGHKAYWMLRLGRRFDVRIVSRLDPTFVKRFGMTPIAPEQHQQQLDELLAGAPAGARIGFIANAGFTVPGSPV